MRPSNLPSLSLESDFEVLKLIGKGTFSDVEIARVRHKTPSETSLLENHLPQPKLVALKRIFPNTSPERSNTELTCLARLKGQPNIVKLLGQFRSAETGIVTIVLEHFPHDDFKMILKEHSMPSVEIIKAYMKTLLSSLKSVHNAGYIHRDVKPANFLFSLKKKTGVLVDFGLSVLARHMVGETKRTEEKQPPPKKRRKVQHYFSALQDQLIKKPFVESICIPERAGTPGFKAPEVLFRASTLTPAIDLWAAGVVLLSLLSGIYPIFPQQSFTVKLTGQEMPQFKDEIEKTQHVHSDAYSLAQLEILFGPGTCRLAAASCGGRKLKSINTNLVHSRRGAPILASKTWTVNTSKKMMNLCKDNSPFSTRYAQKAKGDFKDAFDLAAGLLHVVPSERLKAEQALKHPFFRN